MGRGYDIAARKVTHVVEAAWQDMVSSMDWRDYGFLPIADLNLTFQSQV